MSRPWTYVLSIAAIPVMLFGTIVLVFAGADAYMVAMGGAKPGDAIFLDTLASPLGTSVREALLGICVIAIGLLLSGLARHLRRADS